jgi:trans-aconitate methyltransferase
MNNDKYYHTKASVEEYIQLAKDVNGSELIQKLQAYLPAKSFLLELGSGPGSDWNILTNHYSVVGSDYSAEFLSHLTRTNPSGKFLQLDAITLKTDLTFDGIYSNKVLHHLQNEELEISIKRQAEILNEGGIICHSFWQGEGDEVFKGMHVNYHNQEGLRKVICDLFEILVLEDYKEFDPADSILLIARKK